MSGYQPLIDRESDPDIEADIETIPVTEQDIDPESLIAITHTDNSDDSRNSSIND